MGSTGLTTNSGGGVVAEQLYYPYGETRWSDGTLPTDYHFTDQRHETDLGLYDYNARYYDPYLGRFISADTIVPEPGNPQDLNRYAYVRNSPLNFTDPTGHAICMDGDCNWAVHPVTGEIVQRAPTNSPPIQPGAYDPAESYRQAMGLVGEWAYNTGPFEREFGPSSSLTQDIMYSSGMAEFRKQWAEAGYPSSFEKPHYLDEREKGSDFVRFFQAIPPYFREQVWKPGWTAVGFGSKNPEGSIDAVGGTIGSLDTIHLERVGSGWVKIEVENRMNWESGIRQPGSSESWANIEILGSDVRVKDVMAVELGRFLTGSPYYCGLFPTRQTFYWWEPSQ